MSLLVDAWGKLERAKHHADQLTVEFFEWGARNQPSTPILKTFDAEQGCYIYAVGDYPETPRAWSYIIGDALTNFRAAMDYLAWRLVKAGTDPNPKDENKVAFPVVHDEPAYAGQALRLLPGVIPMHHAIVKRYQPYQRPQDLRQNHPIARVSKLCRLEKHRSIVVAAFLSHQLNAEIPAKFPNFIEDRREARNVSTLRALVPGTELLRIYGRPTAEGLEPEVKVKWDGKFTLTFEETGLPVDVVLREAGAMIAGLLGEFDPIL